MAHFIGYIKGARGEASRLGHKSSGMSTTAASWQGAVDVWLYHDEKTGTDMARVSLKPWHGHGIARELYDGPVSGTIYQPKTGQPCACRPGVQRDNCPACEGTGQRIDFAAIRARK